MSALYTMPGNESLGERLGEQSGLRRRPVQVRRFPDEEVLVRIEPPAAQEEVAIVCTLDRADAKLLPLLMAASTARELGAARVGLVAPYLAYMRQDARFHPGEAISANILGQLLGNAFDWLITVDPHLHRYADLADVYPLDARVVHAAPCIAAWIRDHVSRPLLVGPDSESAQWVHEVADALGAPSIVASKQREGDREVTVTLPQGQSWAGCTPVVLDDIISSGHTMIETVRGLRESGASAPVCIGVHGVFAPGARNGLLAAGAARIITSNSVATDGALIDISGEVAGMLRQMVGAPQSLAPEIAALGRAG